MKLSFKPPAEQEIRRFLSQQANQPLVYEGAGSSLTMSPPAGYVIDNHRVQLGTGQPVFERACKALQQWRMFQVGWIQLCYPSTPIQEGETVAVLAHVYGFWSLNACRIVYVVDEREPVMRFGFAYGTLPAHAERGEERFLIEMLPDETVWYDLYAFSRPGTWQVRLGYPLARRLQRRFARDSLAAMREMEP
jgi:uncharacterized protein (UPF0548 family)